MMNTDRPMKSLRHLTILMLLALTGALLAAGCSTAPPADAGTAQDDAAASDVTTDTVNSEEDATAGDSDSTEFNYVVVTREAGEDVYDTAADQPVDASSVSDNPDISLPVERIEFVRTGGPEGSEPVTIIINGDGTYERDGETGAIGVPALEEIDAALKLIDFFGMQATFIGAAPLEENYRYSLTVRRGSSERMVVSEDRYMPDAYQQILGRIYLATQPR